MDRSRIVFFAKCGTLLAVIPLLIYAHSTGAPARSTGAPGDRTCNQAQCHVGSATGEQVSITYSGGTSYIPGERGKFTVTIRDTDTRRAWGFQASARLASNLQRGQAGTLQAGTGQQVICEDDRNPPCRDTAPVQFVTHRMPGAANVFEFEWTPPASDSGEVRVYVAANAANGNGQETGDRIHTASIALTPAAAGARPAITQGGIVDPWTRKAGLAPGTWVEIYGQNFASSTLDWSNAIAGGVLPTTLNGVSVTIGNRPAAISLVAPGQVNALIPADAGTGDVPVVVKNGSGESAPVSIRLSNIAPVVFAPIPATGDRYNAFVVDNQTAALYGAPPAGVRPARPGDIVQLYALGLGPTNPALVTDRVVPVATVANNPVVRFGEVAAEVFGAALISPGLYQINLRVPDVDGEVPLTVEIGGQRSPGNTVILVRR